MPVGGRESDGEEPLARTLGEDLVNHKSHSFTSYELFSPPFLYKRKEMKDYHSLLLWKLQSYLHFLSGLTYHHTMVATIYRHHQAASFPVNHHSFLPVHGDAVAVMSC